MKKLTVIFISIFSLSVFAQNDKIWDYPVKPGTEEWAKFKTGKQMVDACQIPQEIINELSTEKLVEICLNYPLYVNYLAFNDERKGINIIIKNFNGLSELARRKDGTLELIKIYKEFPVLKQISSSTSANYDIPYKLPFLELLLSDSLFIHSLDSTNLIELKQVVLDKYENKLKNSAVYSLHNVKKTMLLATIIINLQEETKKTTEQQNIINNFLQNYTNVDADLLSKISKIIYEL